jgi:hypothetical protein
VSFSYPQAYQPPRPDKVGVAEVDVQFNVGRHRFGTSHVGLGLGLGLGAMESHRC